jgi:hypothetical protein
MTIGEDRVRIKFNPSDNALVAQIKQKSAELIDLCEEQKNSGASHSVTITEPGHQFVNPQTAAAPNPEIIRLWSLAQTHFEDAAMWGVKAATAEK